MLPTKPLFGNCQAYPEKPDFRLGLAGKIKEIFILANNYAVMFFCVVADLGI